MGNLVNLMNKWTDSIKGWSTTSKEVLAEQLKCIHMLMAGALHSSECSCQLSRLVIMMVIEIVLRKLDIKFEGAVMWEGDSGMQNLRWTIVDSAVVDHPADVHMGMFSNNIDVVGALQEWSAHAVCVHFSMITSKVVIFQSPFVAQCNNLCLKAHCFANELGVDDLMLCLGQESLTMVQKVAMALLVQKVVMALLWSVCSVDYEPEGSQTKGLVDMLGVTI